jgi:prolyl-tRNA synthetase
VAKNERITPRQTDYAQWYLDVIRFADMAEPAEVVKGCMVIKPHGYAIWEKIQAQLDRRFKETGHKNAYFPLLIPQSFMRREAEHVEGFAPELAVVTIGGGKTLEEPYVIRPTSETIIGHFFSKWITSWRDLPLLINQWANVIRWELRTRMFLRTGEFLWQEGHTAHATHEEAMEETLRMLEIYAEFAEDYMAMPVIKGAKTDGERFAGALKTFCIEAMMQNGLALQAGTSHDLGQNFGRAFDVKFQNKDRQLDYVWQTSWGVSTRLVGGLIMTHSDDDGLVLPPRLAPVHVAIVPIYRKDEERAQVLEVSQRLRETLTRAGEGLAVELDDRDYKPGNKFYYWEQRGVPLRVEIGPRDVEAGQVLLKRRDNGEKLAVRFDELAATVTELMGRIQQELLQRARQRLVDNTVLADSIDEVEALLEPVSAERGGGKFVMVHLADRPECDARLKAFKATVRCIPLEDHFDGAGRCVVTGEAVDRRVVVAKAY